MREPYANGYKMYSYITSELPKALFKEFTELDGERISIMGHSMGGHGALTLVSSYWFRGVEEKRFGMGRAAPGCLKWSMWSIGHYLVC
jgi:S-formylglutathione hydrolase FrmB